MTLVPGNMNPKNVFIRHNFNKTNAKNILSYYNINYLNVYYVIIDKITILWYKTNIIANNIKYSF